MEVWVVAAKPGNIDGIAFMVDPCPAEGFFFLPKYQGTDSFLVFSKLVLEAANFLAFLVKVTFAAQDNGEYASNGLGFFFNIDTNRVEAYAATGKSAWGALPMTNGLNVWRAQWKNYDNSSENGDGYITVSLNNIVLGNSTINSDIAIDYTIPSNLAMVFRRLHSKGWRH